MQSWSPRIGYSPQRPASTWRCTSASSEEGGNRRPPRDVRYYSAKDPDFFRISRQEQALDILRNVTTTPRDRVRDFSFTAGGGSYAGLFDGTERVLTWDHILWLDRSVLLP